MIRKKKTGKIKYHFCNNIRELFGMARKVNNKRRKRLIEIERQRRFRRGLSIKKENITPEVAQKPVFNISYEKLFLVEENHNDK